jgi:hypothetical protein
MTRERDKRAVWAIARTALIPAGARKRATAALTATVLGALLAGCSIDKGLSPLRSGIEGQVIFRGEAPAATERVVVVAAYTFPPAGPADLAFSDPLPLGKDTVDFRLVLPPGRYPFLGVLWKEVGYPYEIWNLLGAYFQNPSDFLPGTLEVPDRITTISGVRIEADYSRAQPHSESRILGTIRYIGERPADLEEVRLVASLFFPPRNFLDLRIGNAVPFTGETVAYTFPLPPGEYALVGAVGKLKGQDWDPQNIVGLYLAEDPLQPGKVKINSPTEEVANVDFTVDFGRIQRKTDSGVRGTVYFVGSPPADVRQGILVASRSYPPRSLLDILIGPTIPIAGDSVSFAFRLGPGRYEFLGLLLPGPSGQIDVTSIAAYYRDPQDSLRPGAVEIPSEGAWVGSVRLRVDFQRGAIEGTVRFRGAWPTNTEFVRVAAFDIIPRTTADYYKVKGFTDPLPTGVTEAPYHLSLPPGVYRYIIVVWKAVGTSLFDIKQIGLYTNPEDPSAPGSVEVRPGRVVTRVDIDADFGLLRPPGGTAKVVRRNPTWVRSRDDAQ